MARRSALSRLSTSTALAVVVGLCVAPANLTSAQAASVSTPKAQAGPAAVTAKGTAPAAQQTPSDAQRTARESGRRVKVLDLVTETEQTWANPDGTWTTETSTEPERVQDSEGAWHDIDTRLVERDGVVAPRFAATDLTLSNGGDTVFASMTHVGRTLAWRWPGKLPRPTIEGDTATYAGVADGADLVVTALNTGFSHSVILHRRPTGRVRFPIPVTTDGARLTRTSVGGLSMETEDGDTVVSAAPPLMWDATENKVGDPSRVAQVDLSVGRDAAGRPTYTLEPDESFLSDPDTVYPVTVDPSFTKYTNGDVWVQNAGYTTGQVSSKELRAGTYDSGAHKARSFMHFDTTTWNDKKILSAKLIMRNFYSGSCKGAAIEAKRITSAWNGNTLTWANKPGGSDTYMATYSPAHGYTSSCGAANATWTITKMVQGWADGYANNGIMLRATNETSIYTWRKYRSANYGTSSLRPRISVTYNSYPDKPTEQSTSPAVACATGSARPDMTSSAPTLKAKVSDPDKGTVYGKFEVFNTGDTSAPIVSGTSAAVSSGSVASWKLPTGKLVPGKTYSWRARAYDLSLYSSYSSWCEFTVELPTPTLDLPTTLHSTGAELTWNQYVNANDPITEYQIHRGSTANFAVSSSTRVTSLPVSARSWTDSTATPTPADATAETGATYYYRLAVKTSGGALVSSVSQVAQLPKAGGTTKIFGATSPSTDTTLSATQPTTNLDSIGGQPILEVGNNSATYGSQRPVLDFGDLAVIPGGSRVLSADLKLWSTATTGTGATFAAHTLTRDFDESAATWNSADASTEWAQRGGDFDGTALGEPVSISGTAAWQNLDVLGAVRGWITDPASNHGLIVKATDESTPTQRATFASSEASDVAQRPRLAVTFLTKTTANTYYAPYTPQLMSPNDDEQVKITVTNTTDQEWTSADWILSYHWQLPDGTEHSSPEDSQAAAESRELPQNASPGEAVELTVTVKPPVNAQTGVRSDWILAWDLRNRTTGQWLSETEPTIGPLAQTVTVDKPEAKKLGLEDYFQYVGQPTGAGASLVVNQYNGNAVWTYDALSNPSRGVNTFVRMAYNGADKSDTPLGWGWSLSTSTLNQLGTPLDFQPAGQDVPDSVTLVDGDGTTHTFKYDAANAEYTHPDGVHLFLERTSSEDTSRTWVMTRPDATRFYFDDAGYHTATVDKNGNSLEFTYNPVDNNSENAPRALAAITDSDGRTTLTLEYYEKGQDYSYVDETGAKISAATNLTDPDIIGHVESLTDISGRKIAFTYTETGLLAEIVDGSGSGQEKRFGFGYDPDQTNTNTALIAVEDPRGNTTKVAYYAPPPGSEAEVHWRVESLEDRAGEVTGFAYTDPDGTAGGMMHSAATDANGHETTYDMDAFGRPTKVTNAQDRITTLAWDNDHNVVLLEEPPATVGAPAATTTWTYDKVTGYPLTITDAEANRNGVSASNRHTELTYHKSLGGHVANLATKTSALGSTTAELNDHQWVFDYDGKGNLTAVTDPEGVVTAAAGDYQTTYAYDASGQLTSVTDANGNVSSYDDYDSNGYPRLMTDAKDNDTVMEYDVRGNVVAITDANGFTSTYGYDDYGRIGEARQPKSATETVITPAPVYDHNDNVVTAFSPYINDRPAELPTWENTFDAMDRLDTASEPKDTAGAEARVTDYAYDKVGNLNKVTEPKGTLTPGDAADFVTTYDYDSLDQLLLVTNAMGQRIRYTYDDAGNLSKIEDPKKVASEDPGDFTTKYGYDLNGRVTSVVDAAGETTQVTYDADGRTTEQLDEGLNRTVTAYDMRGLVTKVTVPHDPAGPEADARETEFRYDEMGNRTHAVSPRGIATPADPDDFTTQWIYDELNRPVEEVQPKGTDDTEPPASTIYEYDNVGNLTLVSAPPSDGNATARTDTSYDYFANGQLKQSTDPWQITTSYDYNAMGLQTYRAVTAADEDQAARVMRWGYYPDGKLASRSDSGIPVGRHVVLVDNSDEQNVQQTSATGTEWDSVSDSETGTHQGYDYLTHDPGSGTSVFTWKPVIPANGTYRVYVRAGSAATATNAKYTVHHSGGQANHTVDQTTNAGKWVQVGSYDFTKGTGAKITLSDQADGTVAADAVKLARTPTQTELEVAQSKDYAYSYDPNANLTQITDNSAQPGAPTPAVGVYGIAYTELNQIDSVVERVTEAADPSKTTEYTYDTNGNIDSLLHDVAGTQADQYSAYTYEDPRDLLTRVQVGATATDPDPKVTTFTYDARAMRKTQVKDNGNNVNYRYFADRLLKQSVETKRDGTVVSQHDLTYTPNGHRATDTTRLMNANNNNAYLDFARHYTYDPQDRIAEVVKKSAGGAVLETETYVHDAAGNVAEQTIEGVPTDFTYDRNRLLKAKVDGVTLNYNYDPTGRLDTVVADDPARTVLESYEYDGFDRVSRHTKKTDTGDVSSSYTYDPLDRTSTRTKNAGSASAKKTEFTYFGLTETVLSELDATSSRVTKTYQYTAWGERLSQVKHNSDGTTEDSFYGYNPHTDVETLTTADGDTRATYGYTAYGKADNQATTGVDAPDANEPDKEPYNPYRYTGKRWDEATGNLDMGFRDYSPGLNRFLTLDSYNGALSDLSLSTSPWTSNRYSLAGGNPITGIELDGHMNTIGDWGGVSGSSSGTNTVSSESTSGSGGGDDGNPVTDFFKDSLDSITGIPGGVKDMFLGTAMGLSTTSTSTPPQTKSMVSDEALEVQGRGLQATAEGALTASMFLGGGGAGVSARVGAGGLRQLLVGPLRKAGVAKGGERTVTMGRAMGSRVIPYAEKHGYDWYKGTPRWVPRGTLEKRAPNLLRRTDLWFNKRWIRGEMRNGSRIIDIGEPPGMPPSAFYNMERRQVSSYWNYFKDLQP